MLEKIKAMLGMGPGTDYATLVKQGATILDVRSKREYAAGHIKGPVNISIEALAVNLQKLRGKGVPVITCCASGTRSSLAKRILDSNGFLQVHNGGCWQRLQNKIK